MRCGNLGSVVKRESASSNRHISLGDDELDCVDDKLRVPKSHQGRDNQPRTLPEIYSQLSKIENVFYTSQEPMNPRHLLFHGDAGTSSNTARVKN